MPQQGAGTPSVYPLTVPEAGVLANAGSGGGSLPSVTFCGGRGEGALWGLFHQGMNPPSRPKAKAPLPDTNTLGRLGFQHRKPTCSP